MRNYRLLQLAAAPLTILVDSVHGQQASTSTNSAANNTIQNAIPHSFIIEYTSSNSNKRSVDGIHNNPNITVVDTYENAVFMGASISTDSYNIDSLQAIPGVARAWPNERVYLAPSQPGDQVLSSAQSMVNYTTHNITGVSKVQAQGILGQGVKVGIVDSGTWYLHPALGGGFGPGYKIAGGWDFVGNGNWPVSGDKEPDADPLDQMGHGTHVAGIVAGQLDNFVGVAPEVTIHSYKVFTSIDSTDIATLIDAFLTAYDDGMDIITASIGVANNWPDNAWGVVASRLVDQGVVVTIAAGNNGGLLTIGNGGAGKNVLAVASTETEVLPLFGYGASFVDSQNHTTNTTTFGYMPSTDTFPGSVQGWPIVPLTLNTSVADDGCTEWPAGTRNLTGVIPLVRRGTCTFYTKQGYLEELGAEYILFYNNENPLITPSTIDGSSLIALIPADEGAAIIDAYKAGGHVFGNFSASNDVIGKTDTLANSPSTFTSWGPLYDLTMKPDIAAPGGNIYSTYLNDTWAILSGTSMATPFVAGVAALYMSVHGGRSSNPTSYAAEVTNKIISSGVAVPWSDGVTKDTGVSASVAQVGNGLVDADKLINYKTTLSFSRLELNDTRNFQGSHDITITNNGASSLSYTFSSEAMAGFEVYEVSSSRVLKSFSDMAPITLEPTVNLPEGVTLGPGESTTVTITFENPETLGWNDTMLPLYSGKVYVTSSSGETLSVPYLGMGADMKSELDPINSPGYPWGNSGNTRASLTTDTSFSFNLSAFGANGQDFPVIYSDLLWGSRQIRWDIYESGWDEGSWTYPPVEGENGYLGPATYWYDQADATYFDLSYNDPNDTDTYPVTNAQYGGWQFWWFGKLGNGSQIANGNYTWRFATLLPFGDPTQSEDWEIFKVHGFSVTGHY